MVVVQLRQTVCCVAGICVWVKSRQAWERQNVKQMSLFAFVRYHGLSTFATKYYFETFC